MKYQQIVFENLRKKHNSIKEYGYSKLESRFINNKVFRVLCGLYHALRFPKGSMLVMTSGFFLDYFIPLTFNRLWKKHVYFVFIHHLVHLEKRTYLRRVLERYFIKNAQLAVAVSRTAWSSLNGLKASNRSIEIVNPGLDADRILTPEKKVFPNAPKLLYVGSIEKRKGILYLIESLKHLLDTNFELNLIGFVKEPEYFQSLEEVIRKLRIKNRVYFIGRLSREELKYYYQSSSVFVFPSLLEGYGMVTAEAMAYGLPVVASRIEATEELIEDGVEGMLVEPGNSEQLGSALKKVLTDKDLLKEFSRNALKRAETFPTWEESSDKIWRIIDEYK